MFPLLKGSKHNCLISVLFQMTVTNKMVKGTTGEGKRKAKN